MGRVVLEGFSEELRTDQWGASYTKIWEENVLGQWSSP